MAMFTLRSEELRFLGGQVVGHHGVSKIVEIPSALAHREDAASSAALSVATHGLDISARHIACDQLDKHSVPRLSRLPSNLGLKRVPFFA